MPKLTSRKAHPQTRLGATPLTGGAVAFAVYAADASGVRVLLLSEGAENQSFQLHLGEQGLWSGVVDDCGEGQRYLFEIFGEEHPESGTVVSDPYAKAFHGKPDWNPTLDANTREPGVLPSISGVVIADDFPWDGDEQLFLPWSDLVIYEAHPKGLTRLMPGLPEHLAGTYAGLASDEAVGRLRDLGITAIELLPVHQHLNDGFLVEKGLTNYWGYSTLGYFAPHNEYASDPDPRGGVREFKGMVKALHSAGIEVILDVVYNHTAEGGQGGPTLNFRGLDDSGYYKKPIDDDNAYWDCTGCGNTFDLYHPRGLQLVLDSLRYWVEEMHVDGFRFDLAVALAREPFEYKNKAAFFKAVAQDPILHGVKMIAEPWDVGQMDSYQIGNFPAGWSELNGKYRDATRRFWRGDGGVAGEFAGRFTGSQRTFAPSDRGPYASVNFVTCHDGFTLRDMVSYEQKHNEANGENNRDGTDNNYANNLGVEGETDDNGIRELRLRQQRNLLSTLILSSGVPFLTAGDERNRTQGGNNNGYCQDNELSWIDWSDESAEAKSLTAFVTELLAFRRDNPCFSPGTYLRGDKDLVTGIEDIRWIDPDCVLMSRDKWHAESTRAFGAILDRKNDEGLFLLLFNPTPEEISFSLPGLRRTEWSAVLDTVEENPFKVSSESSLQGDTLVQRRERSFAILRLAKGSARDAQKTRRPRKRDE